MLRLLNMFEKLMNNLIKFSADMSYCGNNDVREYNNSLEIIKTTESDNIIDEKISKYEAVKRIYSRPFVLWGAIYKKYIFDDIRMPVGEIGEDEAIATDILDKCNIISYTNSAMYNYRIRLDGNSVTTSGFSEAYFSWPKHCKHNLDYIKEHYSDLISLAEKKYYMGIVLCLNGASENFKRYEIQTKKLILLLRKNILSILSNSYISIKEKICILLIIFNYRFYVFIIKRLGKKYM